jgi:murein DD-endopeptidase MepM/ murein hydrolase activator NlpD
MNARACLVFVMLAGCTGARIGDPATEGADAADPTDASAVLPVCSCYYGAGKYCGSGVTTHAAGAGCTVPGLSAGDLYSCAGTKTAPGTWTVAQACASGCNVAPPGVDDSCKNADDYYLPWAAGVSHTCTQGHNQGSHTGNGANAWDFGMPNLTPVWASRAGTVSMTQFLGAGDACYYGVPVACTSCFSGSTDCTNRGNYVVVNHGDGTQALYLHLWEVDVHPGQAVAVGQLVGKSGTSGCACGAHLHFMVSTASSSSYYPPSIPISFVEAGVPVTGQVVTSQNP